jgi:hypothetical protein
VNKDREAEVARADVRISASREYVVKLMGAEVKRLIDLIRHSPFKGEDAFVVVDILERLQAPILHEAHGATPDEETEDPTRNGRGHDGDGPS